MLLPMLHSQILATWNSSTNHHIVPWIGEEPHIEAELLEFEEPHIEAEFLEFEKIAKNSFW